ncbi:hypothetical protein BDV12DRAFT_29615 [Aspergillus spectabilis]
MGTRYQIVPSNAALGHAAAASTHWRANGWVDQRRAGYILNEACTLISDLINLRGDMARGQRENMVMRGVRDNACQYLAMLITRCLDKATQDLQSSRTSALVLIVLGNWAFLSSITRYTRSLAMLSKSLSSQPARISMRAVAGNTPGCSLHWLHLARSGQMVVECREVGGRWDIYYSVCL